MLFKISVYTALAMALFQTSAKADGPSGASLWAQYAKAPDINANIPNCSYAGYHYGDSPLPTPKVVANVRDEGAKGDGTTDDTAAFAAAIEKAHASGGGAVLVPAGNYVLGDVVRIKYDNIVLRGEGSAKTTLSFAQPLSKLIGRITFRSLTQWSWAGGLVWIGPASTFNDSGKLATETWHTWEAWAPGESIGAVADAERGQSQITLDKAPDVKPGDYVILEWLIDPSHSFLEQIGGNPIMKEWKFERATWLNGNGYDWPVQIKAVTGNSVTLCQPLRVPIKPQWNVQMKRLGPSITESGVEGMTIQCPAHTLPKHNLYDGYNGIYINRAINCFARDVVIENVDNGLIHAAAKNTTVQQLRITGTDNHHATALRESSADNLITDFTIESKPMHGINMEWLGSGNVWRRGKMLHGTFDSHGGMSFDNIKTDITVNNDGKPGGAKDAGPFVGAHIVEWNIRITNGNGQFINQPEQFTMGAIVGVQGSPIVPGVGFNMPAGDKGTIVADEGRVPAIVDLYDAELRLRLKKPL